MAPETGNNKKISDFDILLALFEQVRKAAAGSSEKDTVTYITEPMYKRFLSAIETEYKGIIYSVYGSSTVIIDSNDFWSFSLRKKT